MKKKTKTPKHLHLYKRIDLVPSYKVKNGADSYLVYKCQKPNCPHWIPINQALNALCECNICHNPMVLDKENMRKAMPRCQQCIKRKIKPEVELLDEFLKDI